jgi:hypothetical protein
MNRSTWTPFGTTDSAEPPARNCRGLGFRDRAGGVERSSGRARWSTDVSARRQNENRHDGSARGGVAHIDVLGVSGSCA